MVANDPATNRPLDLVLRNARLGDGGNAVDIGIAGERIAAIAPCLGGARDEVDARGRLVLAGFVETHLHLDKSCILERCRSETGTLGEAIAEVSRAKREFTEEDLYARASATLERAIVQGTTHVRSHVEIDPGIGLTGYSAIRRVADAYRWAVDVETCVFPQEGLTNYPGTEELMRAALAQGAQAVGAAPYTDVDPRGQIDRVFRMALDFDVDVDMHLDLGDTTQNMQTEYVCEVTRSYRYGGRVTIGHVTQMSLLPQERFDALAGRIADAGVAVTVLPATDLYLMGRGPRDRSLRGVLAAHELVERGINCSLSTNNVLNPFTPYGDCSLVRMANLYANVCHVGSSSQMRTVIDMIGPRAAALLRLDTHGVSVGKQADLVMLDCMTPEEALARIAAPLMGFKRGRRTFTREPPTLHRP